MAEGCVRVDPPFVQFSDVTVGQVFKMKVTVENVDKTSKEIMMGKPGLKVEEYHSNNKIKRGNISSLLDRSHLL